nr:hypothetical protein [Tanacetum cinerariifolium]
MMRMPPHTSANANSVPMLVRSTTKSMLSTRAGTPTNTPVTMVLNEGVALRVFALFGGGRDGVEADVGKKHRRHALEHPADAVGGEGRPVGGLHVERTHGDNDEHNRQLQSYQQ